MKYTRVFTIAVIAVAVGTYLTRFINFYKTSSRADTVSQPTIAQVYFMPNEVNSTNVSDIRLNLYIQTMPGNKISGATISVRYPQNTLQYKPYSGIDDAACPSPLSTVMGEYNNTSQGVITITRVRMDNTDSLPSNAFCFGTLSFSLIPDTSLPSSVTVLIDDTSDKWDIVGPFIKYQKNIDQQRSSVVIRFPATQTPTNSPNSTPTITPSVTPAPTLTMTPTRFPTPTPTSVTGTVIRVKDPTIVNNLISNSYLPDFACQFGKWCKWQRMNTSNSIINANGSISVKTSEQSGDFGSCWIQWIQNAKADGSTYRIRAIFDSDFPMDTSFIQIQTYNKVNYLKTPWYTTGRTTIDERVAIRDNYQNFIAIKFCSWGSQSTQTLRTATLTQISLEKINP